MVKLFSRLAAIPWHRRLRVKIATGTASLVAVSILTTLLVTGRLVTSRALATAEQNLHAAESAFHHVIDSRTEFAIARVQLITMLPVFRAHLTDPLLRADGPTMQAMSEESRSQLAARWLVITDRYGATIAVSGWPEGIALSTLQAATAGALARRPSHQILPLGRTLSLVVSEPALFDTRGTRHRDGWV